MTSPLGPTVKTANFDFANVGSIPAAGASKFCGKCKTTKPAQEFNKRRGILQSTCRTCQNAYSAQHYLDNKPAYTRRARKCRQLVLVELIEIKNVPCHDCKEKFHHVAMDFDHVRGVKLFDVARGSRKYSKSTVLAEIAKCEIVCSNCHRVRTFNRIKARKKPQ